MNNSIIETIKMYEQQGDFNYAKVSDEMIETAENTLGVKLPEQYIEFLKMFGHGGIGGIETIGVGLTGRLIFVDTTLDYREEEYGPYDEYFYGSKDNIDEFNYAWLHHIHNNAHHWQYWVLVNDEGTVALDMPYNYIIEMILDWWSFSWKSNNLYEIFSWYEEHKKTMILNENTKIIVESILADMKEILDKQGKVS